MGVKRRGVKRRGVKSRGVKRRGVKSRVTESMCDVCEREIERKIEIESE